MSKKPEKFSLSIGTRVALWMADVFRADKREDVTCPACNGPINTVSDLVVHLNDDHDWRREWIADHLDGQRLNMTVEDGT